MKMSPEDFLTRAMGWNREAMSEGGGAGMTVRAEFSALSEPDIERWKSAKSSADSEMESVRSEMKSNPSVMGDRGFMQKFNALSQRRQFINEGLQVLTGEKQPQPRTMELLNQGEAGEGSVGSVRRYSFNKYKKVDDSYKKAKEAVSSAKNADDAARIYNEHKSLIDSSIDQANRMLHLIGARKNESGELGGQFNFSGVLERDRDTALYLNGLAKNYVDANS